MSKQLYPRPRREKDKSGRRWRVDYDLAYDGGGSGPFINYYRTRKGAKIAAFWNIHVSSWGGSAILTDQEE